MSGKLIGVGDCLATLSAMKKGTVIGVARRALLPAAEILRAGVAARAPELTGNLKRSVRVDRKSQVKRRRRGAVDVTVIADDAAAVPTEFGTSDTPIQPFFRPAIEAEKAAMFAAVADALRTETTKTAQRAARRSRG
ncbi:HK97-gp10 family putative phage morphogenesis protein [Sphingomonas sp.]|uniref:HK97-gp10 family putative phage morphogenesis protein n=1 Tax=Sphingomonas sp. TaxID=28214 RepID=UPI002D7F9465|nr:HK97-gp10 family putative phage morphogenesis protein [Sphingomonas sp.]HEU0045082.1 HK97-gp10 family putative phage morphogenesis protein [Sphingomonas sp.]